MDVGGCGRLVLNSKGLQHHPSSGYQADMITAHRTTLRLQRTIVRTMSTGQKVSDAAGTTLVSGGPVERAIREKVLPANTLSPPENMF